MRQNIIYDSTNRNPKSFNYNYSYFPLHHVALLMIFDMTGNHKEYLKFNKYVYDFEM